MNKISIEKLSELLSYDPDTGILKWKVARAKMREGDVAGCINKNGYLQLKVDQVFYYAHRIAWALHYGYFPENQVDHINRDRLDNRITNLREVSQSCNMRNSGIRSNNKSGVCGVSIDKPSGKWVTSICFNSKDRYLGIFDDFDEAVAIRLAAEQCLEWEGCDSSSSAYQYIKNNILGASYVDSVKKRASGEAD